MFSAQRRKMPRKRLVKPVDPDSSDDDEPLSALAKEKPKEKLEDDSSSESDIENYLQKADKIDLNSPFFNLQKENVPSFDKIETNILSGVSRLTDSESEKDETPEPSTSKLNFGQLHEYTAKMEEAKRHIAEYNKRKQAQKELDIGNLLAAGESKDIRKELLEGICNSSDFESCDSENEGWEEVKEEEKGLIPSRNLEITVDVPGVIKKKKDVDILAVIKRRINRVRKENQVLVHKVHLLCWIAHGNYINSQINSQNVLGIALSLLPSEKCYPENRVDLTYLEQILKWFRNAVINVEKKIPDLSFEEILETQIAKKEAYDRRNLVYIFVAILRALGIHCRLVLSLQVEPLRPSNSELLSLSAKAGPSATKEEVAKVVGKKSSSKSKTVAEDGTKSTSAKKEQKKSVSESSRARNVKSTTEDGVKNGRNVAKATTSKSTSAENEQKNRTKSVSEIIRGKNVKSTTEDDVKNGRNVAKATTSTRSKSTSAEKEQKKSVSVITRGRNVKSTTEDGVKNGRNVAKATTSKSTSAEKEQKKPEITKNVKSTTEDGVENGRNVAKATISTRSKSTSAEKEDRNVKKPNLNKLKVPVNESKSVQNEVKNRSKSTSEVLPKKACIKIKLKSPQKGSKRKLRSEIPQLDGANDSDEKQKPNLKKLKQEKAPCPLRTHLKRLKTITKYRDSDSEEDFEARSPFTRKCNDSPKAVNLKKLKNHVPKGVDVRNDVVNLVKKSIKQQKDIDRSKIVKKRVNENDSDDSDYIPEKISKKRESADDFSPKIKIKQRVKTRKDAEEEVKIKKQGVDIWAEVFLESEEKWISVDVVKGQVHCVNELYTRASHPVSYIIAWNNDNTLKDITRRYCTNFNTITRKLRIDANWWEKSLKPFITVRKTSRDKEEDEELDRQQVEKPLPTSIAEYKNHPLYVLKRHLLKFQALYPPDPAPLGFVRNEAVYPRECVYTLHSRDIWLKHAKVVKPGEQPYKIVKARPRWDKLSSSIISGEMLEIFGLWQTQDYEPPTAENGVVPRNAFGNVELYKACMLPKKTVHLQLPGLNKIAKRMNLDCAPALVGFDFSGGWNHPTYDGFIVCEENADILVAAWEIEQEEIVKREQEKIEKRVYGNWRKLIRGLLIRERLKVKYDLGEPSGSGVKKKKGLPKLATKKK